MFVLFRAATGTKLVQYKLVPPELQVNYSRYLMELLITYYLEVVLIARTSIQIVIVNQDCDLVVRLGALGLHDRTALHKDGKATRHYVALSTSTADTEEDGHL